jgi:hypothetical protein
MATSKIVILGVPHQVQGDKFAGAFGDECYCDILEELIAIHSCDFIFEEASGRIPSHASKKKTAALGYLDVDPAKEDREKYGLAKDTGESFMHDPMSETPCESRLEHVERHEAREQFWVARIKEKQFTSALMICGMAHSLSLSFRLKNAGYQVEKCIQYWPHDKLCRHIPKT